MKTVNIPASSEFDMNRKTHVLEIEVKIFEASLDNLPIHCRCLCLVSLLLHRHFEFSRVLGFLLPWSRNQKPVDVIVIHKI